MPKPLVGKTTAFGRVGRTLGKAFRDDEELKGAADLGALIQGALDESESLVVICSPRSAPSTYVNEEIANFKRLGREARIVPVIIGGKPHDTETECFPGALKRKAGFDGLLTDEPAEPIAVDVRVHGKRRTLLKVVAGITGVEFDELERRDKRRRSILWDSEDGHRIRTIGPAGPNSVKFSESGDFVVTSSTGHAAFVSDAQTGEPIGGIGLALRGHPWHACDWHGLKSLEGWLQFIRYWGTRAGLPWEYEPWETSALDRWLKAKPIPAL